MLNNYRPYEGIIARAGGINSFYYSRIISHDFGFLRCNETTKLVASTGHSDTSALGHTISSMKPSAKLKCNTRNMKYKGIWFLPVLNLRVIFCPFQYS